MKCLESKKGKKITFEQVLGSGSYDDYDGLVPWVSTEIRNLFRLTENAETEHESVKGDENDANVRPIVDVNFGVIAGKSGVLALQGVHRNKRQFGTWVSVIVFNWLLIVVLHMNPHPDFGTLQKERKINIMSK